MLVNEPDWRRILIKKKQSELEQAKSQSLNALKKARKNMEKARNAKKMRVKKQN